MLKRRLLTSIAHCYEQHLLDNHVYQLNAVIVDTQPPFCDVCKQYLTEFACNSFRKVECPYFENDDDSKKNKA